MPVFLPLFVILWIQLCLSQGMGPVYAHEHARCAGVSCHEASRRGETDSGEPETASARSGPAVTRHVRALSLIVSLVGDGHCTRAVSVSLHPCLVKTRVH